METLAEMMRRLMTRAGMQHNADLIRIVDGLNDSNMSLAMRGRQGFSAETVENIAAALKLSPDERKKLLVASMACAIAGSRPCLRPALLLP